MNRKRIASKLRDLRIDADITQKQLASILGVSEATIGMYEQGRRIPTDEIKKRYAEYFKVSIDDIFFTL